MQRKAGLQRPAVFFLSVQLLFQMTGPRSWTANGQRLFRSSSEPRTKLLVLERRTWAQRAGTDLPILSENGEPLTVNVVFHQRSAYSGSSSVQRFLAREAELAFAKQRLAARSAPGLRQQTGSYLACCRRELCVRRCFRALRTRVQRTVGVCLT